MAGRPSLNRTPSYPGVISLNEFYRLDEAKSRLGWSDSALRSARRAGLQLLTCGKRKYVTGAELLRFLQACTVAESRG